MRMSFLYENGMNKSQSLDKECMTEIRTQSLMTHVYFFTGVRECDTGVSERRPS